MIHYKLVCDNEHNFESWFTSSVFFDEQKKQNLLECPFCGSNKVDKALMAPSFARLSQKEELPSKKAPVDPDFAENVPDYLVAVLQKIRSEVEAHYEYVGPRLAETAKDMSKGKIPSKGIYGVATPDEAKDLYEEGISFVTIPWVRRSDS